MAGRFARTVLPGVLGAAILALAAACTAPPAPSAPPVVQVSGSVVAGPVCPVERQPPDPDCAPRPVPGATVTFDGEGDGERRSVVTDAAGAFIIGLAEGSYVVSGEPVEGLMGEPQPIEIDVGPDGLDGLVLEYDTGIR